MRITLFGLFGTGNFGNDATLEATLQQLRRHAPGAEVACICADPERVATEHGVKTFGLDARPRARRSKRTFATRIASAVGRRLPLLDAVCWSRSIQAIRTSSMLIIPGTGILDDFGCRPGELPLQLFRWCLVARVCGVPVHFVGVGAGPIVNSRSRWLMATAARLATSRSFRDEYSRDFMAGLGVDTAGDLICPDLVFALNTSGRETRSTYPNRSRLGLGVMDYRGWKDRSHPDTDSYERYLVRLLDFALKALREEWRVILVPGQKSDTSALNDLVNRLREQASPHEFKQVEVPEVSNFGQLLTALRGVDALVASRYHNLVAGIMLGIPVISIGYAPKNDALLAGAGLRQSVHQIDDFSADEVLANLKTVACGRTDRCVSPDSLPTEYAAQLNEVFVRLVRRTATS